MRGSSSGADGIRSVVARVDRGDRRSAPFAEPGRADVPPAGCRRRRAPRDARMIVLRDGYIGIAPVPRDRVNVGIVLGSSWRRPARERRRRSASVGRSSGRSEPPRAIGPSGGRRAVGRRSPGRPRSGIGSRDGPVLAGSLSATQPGSSTRSPARGSTARSCRPSSRLQPSSGPWPVRATGPPTSTSGRCAGGSSARTGSAGLVQAFLGQPGAVRVRRPSARQASGGPRDGRARHGRSRPGRASARSPLPRLAPCAMSPETRCGRGQLCPASRGR